MSHNLCAHPDCGQPLVEGDTVVGEVCHIKGERQGAARYDEKQSDDERNAYENLIGMCRKHHKIIDTENDNYPVERLLEMKRQHEQSDERRYVISDALVQRIGEMLAVETEAGSRAPVATIYPDWTIRESSSTSGLTFSMSQARSGGLRSAARSWITSRRDV